MEAPQPHLLLELLLPMGRSGRTLVLGSAGPQRLCPPAGTEAAQSPVDLIVVAPTEAESRSSGWIAQAAETCGDLLSADGLAYVIVGRPWRRRSRLLLRERGLAIEAAFLHLPDLATSRHVVPLDPKSARQAFGKVVPLAQWKRAATSSLLLPRITAALTSMHSSVALVARRSGAPPMLGWLDKLAGRSAGTACRGFVVDASWRTTGPRVKLHLFPAGAHPPAIAKVALDSRGESDSVTEGSRLAVLGPAARRAGAAIPAALATARLRGSPVLVEDRLPGEVVARLLGRRPAVLEDAVERVAAWLERWQCLTRRPTSIDHGQLRSEVLSPAQFLVPQLDGGEQYLAALTRRCSQAEGTVVPLVSSHNDLTMWNLVLDRDGALGVVDWEAAEEATLPLKDFFYAVADAVAATERYRDRLAAVKRCFSGGSDCFTLIGRLETEIATAIGASPELVELSFHSCWLGHAANERRAAGPSVPTPFQDIVQWLIERERAGDRRTS